MKGSLFFFVPNKGLRYFLSLLKGSVPTEKNAFSVDWLHNHCNKYAGH